MLVAHKFTSRSEFEKSFEGGKQRTKTLSI